MNIIHTDIACTRRQFLALLGGLCCIPALPGCSLNAKAITIGLHTWPGYEPTPLARMMGWLDEKQVKLVKTGAATDSLELLKQGKIDGAGLTLDEVLRARENGIPLSVILVCDISAGADLLLARPEIKTLAEIKGRRIGVEHGALGALMLHQVLQAAGLKVEDITPVSLTVDQQVDAWKHGRIDAAVTYEPSSNRIMEMGGHRLFDSSMTPDLVVDVFAVRTSLLDHAHGEALRHLVASHLKGLNHLNTNPDDAAYRLAPGFKLPPEKVMASFKGLVLPDLENNLRLLATAQPALLTSAKRIARILQEAGLLQRQADLTELLHPEYLPRHAT